MKSYTSAQNPFMAILQWILTVICLISLQFATAQNPAAHRIVVMRTVEAINTHTATPLNEYLADDFSISGQKGEIARLVLKQLLKQINETVHSYEKIDQKDLNNGTELRYSISYKRLGKRTARFVFDEKNMLRELELFQMEVKTMDPKSLTVHKTDAIIEVPFEWAGKLIAVEVLLNGIPQKFILDSGAPKVILNASHLEKPKHSQSYSSAKGVSGNIQGVDITTVETLDFSGLQLQNEKVLSMDLAHLEEELDYEFYGSIGYELIQEYDLLIDYSNQRLTLIPADRFDSYQKEHLSHQRLTTIPFELSKHLPIVAVEINGHALRLAIDTGAESNLLDDHWFPVFKSSLREQKTEELTGANQQKTKVPNGTIRGMTIGPKKFKNLNTSFSDISHLTEGYQVTLDGILGYPVLSQQKTLISFQRKELIFIE